MISINKDFVEKLSVIAKQKERKRTNHNFHSEGTDPLQRMLNALEPDSYVQPHKHENPDKREVFIILTGKLAVLEFNDNGEISGFVILSTETGNYAVEIPERTWHTIIALEPGTVVYEVKDGPYDPLIDKNFAKWAPEEGSAHVTEYMNSLVKKLEL